MKSLETYSDFLEADEVFNLEIPQEITVRAYVGLSYLHTVLNAAITQITSGPNFFLRQKFTKRCLAEKSRQVTKNQSHLYSSRHSQRNGLMRNLVRIGFERSFPQLTKCGLRDLYEATGHSPRSASYEDRDFLTEVESSNYLIGNDELLIKKAKFRSDLLAQEFGVINEDLTFPFSSVTQILRTY